MTGAEYPTIELGGKQYELKFTRGLQYRLEKAGNAFNPVFTKTTSTLSLANLIDTLHMMIGFEGTHEELTEIAFDKRDEISAKLIESWGKVVLPSLQARKSAQAAAKPNAEAPTVQ
jgi:hypothetical protein